MKLNNYSIDKLNILLTGGSSGIGKSIAQALIDNGANVGIISRHDPSIWSNGLKSWNGKKNWIKADFNNPQTIEASIDKWVHNLLSGKIDVLILCAVTYGSDGRHPFETTTLDEWQELIAVNATAPFVLTRYAVKNMRLNDNGLVIGLTSDVAYKSGPERVGYSVSKTAMRAMLDGVAEELAHRNIEIVQILPEMQVKTEGLMKRRPENFNFEGYADPSVFAKPVLSIIARDRQPSARYIINQLGDVLPLM